MNGVSLFSPKPSSPDVLRVAILACMLESEQLQLYLTVFSPY